MSGRSPGQGGFGTHKQLRPKPAPPECDHEWVNLSGSVPPVEQCIHCWTLRVDDSDEWKGVPDHALTPWRRW